MARLMPRTLAGQAVALQMIAILVLVIIGSGLAAYDASKSSDEAARERVTGIAVALANAPSTMSAIASNRDTPASATALLQPTTEEIREQARIAFITVMAPDRRRYTHSTPELIGGMFRGTIAPALRGKTFTETYTGSLGPSIRAVAPVMGPHGSVIGLVAAGITVSTLAERWTAELPLISVVALIAVGFSGSVIWILRRRLLRQTRGLAPDELRVMYDHHEAVLHSIAEGLVVVEDGAPVLINDEARRLFGAGGIDEELPDFLRRGDADIRDELHVVGDRILMVNRSAVSGSRDAVVTLRDRTEVQAALGELDSMRMFAESLRSQAHEAANTLHTVIGLVEMGRSAEAVRYATTDLELSQHLVDRLTLAVSEPALVALLLGKSSQAAERGIELSVTDETRLDVDIAPSASEIVTVAGNLIDNALDACDRDDPWVEVTVCTDNDDLVIIVADSGAGLDEAEFERARERGYSTKADDPSKAGGRGLGLALVSQVVARYNGTIATETTYGSVVIVRLPLSSDVVGGVDDRR